MSSFFGTGKVKEISFEAQIIRADGTKVDLGKIDSTSKLWRYGPGRVASYLRIKRANRRMH